MSKNRTKGTVQSEPPIEPLAETTPEMIVRRHMERVGGAGKWHMIDVPLGTVAVIPAVLGCGHGIAAGAAQMVSPTMCRVRLDGSGCADGIVLLCVQG